MRVIKIDFDNILLDKKSHKTDEKISIYDISDNIQLLWVQNHCVCGLKK